MSYLNNIKQYLLVENISKNFEHEKPKNWIWGVIYFNKRDYRFLVSKINPMLGWTFNFAHPITFIVLVLISLLAIFPSTYSS